MITRVKLDDSHGYTKKKKKGLFVRATLYFTRPQVKILINYINIYILKKYFKE